LPFSFFLYEKKDNQLWWYFNGWVTFLFDSATLRASYFMVKETRKVLQRKLCQILVLCICRAQSVSLNRFFREVRISFQKYCMERCGLGKKSWVEVFVVNAENEIYLEDPYYLILQFWSKRFEYFSWFYLDWVWLFPSSNFPSYLNPKIL
jgi:hypothetical protein